MIFRIRERLLDSSARALTDAQGSSIRVSARTFDTLLLLIQNRERAISRDELIRHIWGRDNVSDAQLAQIILFARRAVGVEGELQSAIRTVPGFGYQWVADVEILHAHPASAPDPASVEAPLADAPGATPSSADPHEPAAATATALAEPVSKRPGSNDALPQRRARGRHVLLALLILGLALALVNWPERPAGPPASAGRVIILPIEVDAGADAAWMRLGAMDLIASRLRAGGLVVPPTENVLQLIANHAGAATPEDRLAIQQAAQGELLVLGSARRVDDRWQVELQARRANGLQIKVTGKDADAIHAAAASADRLLAALGRAVSPELDSENGPDTLLQRARAATLENDFELARSILAGATEPQRSSPEVRLRLAEIDMRAGQLELAEEAFSRLLTDPGLSDWLRARVLTARGSLKLRRNDADAGAPDFDAAVLLLDDGQHPLALGKALNGRSISHRRRQQIPLALADYGRARLALERAGDDLALGRLTVSLAVIDTQRFHWLDAIEHFSSATVQFENYGAINELVLTLTNIAECERQLLRWRDAQALTEKAIALLPKVVDPGTRAQVLVGRAQALLAIGRIREAGTLIDSVHGGSLNPALIESGHAALLHAELAWANGDVAGAAAEAAALWQRLPVADPTEIRSRAALILLRALIASGDQAGAARIAKALAAEVDASDITADPLLQLAQGQWLLSIGRRAEAETLWRSALVSADTHNSALEISLVADALGRMLIADQRGEDAAALIGRVAAYGDQDFRCALLLAWLYQSQGDQAGAAQRLAIAGTLAGERAVEPANAPR